MRSHDEFVEPCIESHRRARFEVRSTLCFGVFSVSLGWCLVRAAIVTGVTQQHSYKLWSMRKTAWHPCVLQQSPVWVTRSNSSPDPYSLEFYLVDIVVFVADSYLSC